MLFNNREERVHERICAEIEARLRKSGAPREIRLFLLERWSFLLAGIYFSHGDRHPDWEAGWHTVNALLWSLSPKLDQTQTERFLKLLPVLLERLHSGCDAMRLSHDERDRFFSTLTPLHAAVMRAGLGMTPGSHAHVSRVGQDAEQVFRMRKWREWPQSRWRTRWPRRSATCTASSNSRWATVRVFKSMG